MSRRFLFGLLVSCLLATGCAASPSIFVSETASASDAAPAAASSEPVAALVSDVSRDQAIAQLVDVAFLSFSDSSCVIDALHAEIGIYDFNHPAAMEQANQAELMAMCTADDAPAEVESPAESEAQADETTASTGSDDSLVEGVVASAVDGSAASSEDPTDEDEPTEEAATDKSTSAEAPVEEVAPAQPPTFTPGGLATGSVEIAGMDLSYVVVTPAGFSPGASAPVFIALPDDDFSRSDNREFIEETFVVAAAERGWVVISPTLNGRAWTDERNADLIFEFSQWIGTWVAIEGGRPHLGGIGSGGTGAFAIAERNPSAIESLAVYPGMPPTPLNETAPRLAQIPVRMWVINNDGNPWIAALTTARAAIAEAGGNVKLDVLTLEEVVLFVDGNELGRLILGEMQTLR